MRIANTPAPNPDQFRYEILAAAERARHEHLFMEAAPGRQGGLGAQRRIRGTAEGT